MINTATEISAKDIMYADGQAYAFAQWVYTQGGAASLTHHSDDHVDLHGREPVQ
jgi:hypothetical protein